MSFFENQEKLDLDDLEFVKLVNHIENLYKTVYTKSNSHFAYKKLDHLPNLNENNLISEVNFKTFFRSYFKSKILFQKINNDNKNKIFFLKVP